MRYDTHHLRVFPDRTLDGGSVVHIDMCTDDERQDVISTLTLDRAEAKEFATDIAWAVSLLPPD